MDFQHLSWPGGRKEKEGCSSSDANGISKGLGAGKRKIYVKLPSRNASKLSKGCREGMEHTFLGPVDSQSWYFIYRCMFGWKLL